MIQHPRPLPVEKKVVLPPITASLVDGTSPGPEVVPDSTPLPAADEVKKKKAPRKKPTGTVAKKGKGVSPTVSSTITQEVGQAVLSEALQPPGF